jgi:hypothetical protein
MAKDRLSLQTELEGILGSTNVYYQPPASLKLKYPCIIYKLDKITGVKANNKKYLGTKRYLITVVDRDPNTLIADRVLDLEYSTFENYFVVDNLNHYICSLHW